MSELVRALQERSLGVEGRLKVACYLWSRRGTDTTATTLERWACGEICAVYSKRARAPTPTSICQRLWQFTSLLLSERKDGVQLSVSQHLIQAMGDVLSAAGTSPEAVETAENALSCLDCLLKLPSPPAVLYKYELMVTLLLSAMRLALSSLSRDSHTNSAVIPTLQSLLVHYTYLQGIQGNQKKVFTTTCTQLLEPVFLLLWRLLPGSGAMAVEPAPDGVRMGIANSLRDIINILFSKDHRSGFTSALGQAATGCQGDKKGVGKGKAPPTSYNRQLFQTLEKLLESPASHMATVISIPVLFESFLAQNSKERSVSVVVEFDFFSRLLQLLGWGGHRLGTGESAGLGKEEGGGSAEGSAEGGREEDKEELERDGTKEGGMEETAATRIQLTWFKVDWPSVLKRASTDLADTAISPEARVPVNEAVSKCLALLLKYGVYQVSEDASGGGRQALQLQGLCMRLLERLSASSTKVTFSSLATILRLNHKLLEPLLPGVWMLTLSSSSRGEHFTEVCVEVYAKLRQLPVLMKNILEALKLFGEVNIHLPLSPTFTPNTEHCLSVHLAELPPGQCLEVLDLLCQTFQEDCLSKLQAGCYDGAKRKKRRTNCGSEATELARGDSETVMPVVLQLVDVFGVVLSSLPRETWSSRLAERAHTLLQNLYTDACLPLITLCPLMMKSWTFLSLLQHPDVRPSLCSASLLLLCKYYELWVRLQAGSHDCSEQPDWMTGMSWQQTSSKEVLIPSSWSSTIDEDELQPLCLYLLKEMIILQLRFGVFGDGMPSNEKLLEVVLTLPACPNPAAPSDVKWTGQVLDIGEGNYHLATWALVLTHLPALYSQCTGQHLSHIATFLLHTTLLAPSHAEGEGLTSVTGEGGDGVGTRRVPDAGVTLTGVTALLLDSEAFQEMHTLHKATLGVCLDHAASTLPKGFSIELKEVLEQVSCEGVEEDIFVSRLEGLLQHGVDEGESDVDLMATPRKRRRSEKWVQQVAAYLKLIQAIIPLGVVAADILEKLLVAMVSYLHSNPQSTTGTPTSVAIHATMIELIYLISVAFRSTIVHLHPAGGKGGKKEKDPQSLPVDLLLRWFYQETISLMKTLPLNEEVRDSLLASSLATIEAVFSVGVSQGTYPLEFITTVSNDIRMAARQATERDGVEFFTVESLKAMATITCKAHTEAGTSHKDSVASKVAVNHVLEEMAQTLESASQETGGTAEEGHAPLLSAIVTVLRHRPELLSPRITELLRLLYDHTFHSEPPSIAASVSRLSICEQLEKTSSLLDLLTLPALMSSSSTSPEDAAMETDEEDSEPQLVARRLSITESWQQLLTLLTFFLEHTGGHCRALPWTKGIGKEKRQFYQKTSRLWKVMREGGEEMVSMATGVLETKLNETMKCLLEAADYEEIAAILKHLSQLACQCALQARVFCWCWDAVLSAKLIQGSWRELRKWLTRTLLKCKAITALHQSDTAAVTMAIQLVTRLLSIPQQAGLDGRSVVISLHLCATLNHLDPLPLEDVMAVTDSVTQLVTAMVRSHTAVATSCPAPVFSVVNGLLHIVISQGQELERLGQTGGSDGSVPSCLHHCASHVSRLLELLSRQKYFSKFIPYTIGEFVEGIHKHPLHHEIKQALLPGLFSLMRLCSDMDTAFIQAPVSPPAREMFQTLLTEYHKFHKFSGRV